MDHRRLALYAEDAYRNFGVVYDRFAVTSVSLELSERRPTRRDFTLGLSVVGGVRSNDALRERGVSAIPYFRFLRVYERLRFGVALGSKDGFLWDPNFLGVSLGSAHPRVRATFAAGLGRRTVPELAPVEPLEGWPIPWGQEVWAFEPYGAFELRLLLGLRMDLAARLDFVGPAPQGLLVFAFHHPSRRCMEERAACPRARAAPQPSQSTSSP